MSLYEVLGVSPDCSAEELRTAYRSRARELHPDATTSATDTAMAALNAAWRELNNSETRSRYDQSLAALADIPEPIVIPQPAPQSELSRRQAWVAGVQAQMIRLSRLAGRSATQTLLLRAPRAGRSDYEALVDCIVLGLAAETESRVRAARAAGAAPLDLGVAATLIGIRVLADHLRRASTRDLGTEALMEAELLDRMWDILAHELPSPLELALGGNPHVARRLFDVA